MMRRPPRSTLFPSPTLSRSGTEGETAAQAALGREREQRVEKRVGAALDRLPIAHLVHAMAAPALGGDEDHPGVRSEEHTSELQSRPHLVCRLLLEKNNKQSA